MYLLNKGGVILKSLILCTTASDSICKIALDSLEMKKIRFKACLNPEIEVPKMFYIAKKKGWNLDNIKA